MIARAVNPTADPRDIAFSHPQVGVWWQLNGFDEATGAFRTQVRGNG